MKLPNEFELDGVRHIYIDSDFGSLVIHITEDTKDQTLNAEWVNYKLVEAALNNHYLGKFWAALDRLSCAKMTPCEYCDAGKFHIKNTDCLIRDVMKARVVYEENA